MSIVIRVVVYWLAIALISLCGLISAEPSLSIVAHKGQTACEAYKENTLPAFINAWDMGFAVELDVRLSADDELLVIHDETMERLTGGLRLDAIEDMTAAELLIYDVPTLDQVLAVYKSYIANFSGRLGLMIDVKAPRNGGYVDAYQLGKRVASKLKKLAPDTSSIMVSSFNPFSLRGAAEANKTIGRCLNAGDFSNKESAHLNDVTKWVLKHVLLQKYVLQWSAKPNVVAFEASVLTEKRVKAFQNWGIKVFVWAINRAELVKTFIDWGVDGIVTDRPEVIYAASGS